MAEVVDITFQEVFSEISSTDLVRLLPWYISTAANPNAIPICYMSEALATIMQQGVDAPMATTAPESEGSWALASTSSLVHQTGTPALPLLPVFDLPLFCTPPVEHSLIRLLTNPLHKRLDCSPNGALYDRPGKRAYAETAEADVSSGNSTPQGDGEPPETPLEVPNNDTVASGSTE